MSYVIRIRNNATTEIKDCTMDLDWGEGSLFWLTDGNFGCDCNRGHEFYRGSDEAANELTCGDNRFTILEVRLEDGSIIAID